MSVESQTRGCDLHRRDCCVWCRDEWNDALRVVDNSDNHHPSTRYEYNPWAASVLAREDGTRQEIVAYSSEDEGFEFGSDEEYPREAPLTEREIEIRGKCVEILQILDGVMDKGGQIKDGNYLDICNILKDMYKKE